MMTCSPSLTDHKNKAHIVEQRARLYAVSPPSTIPLEQQDESNYIAPTFPIGPFQKFSHNPIMTANAENDWESNFIYNPAAIVVNGKIWLLYRAQDKNLVSSIGLAWSDDGYSFTTLQRPVLIPTEQFELGGGCEDPRITSHRGMFYLTYTAFDGVTPRLALATSQDMLLWEKHGPLFDDCKDAEYVGNGRLVIRMGVSKAGAIIPERSPVNGKYMMIWGEGHLQLAMSDDLTHWKAKDFNEYFATGVHPWESRLLEPGPPPIKTKDGRYILFYNCSTLGGGKYAYNQYSVGQMLLDLESIDDGPIARLEKPCLVATKPEEREGQVGNVVFCEGIVQYKGKWWMYYGMGDSGIGVATCNIDEKPIAA